MLLYISLLNCFLALLMLVFNWRKNRNVLFLSLLILLISIYTITFQFIVVDQSRFWAAIFYANLAPLWYLPGPLLYWYVRSNLEDKVEFRGTDWLHFIPLVISLVGVFPYLITPFAFKMQTVDALFRDPNIAKLNPPNWLVSAELNLLLRPGFIVAYALFCLGMVMQAQKRFSGSSTVAQDQWMFLRNWMFVLSGILVLICIPSLVLSYYYSVDMDIDFNRINTYSMSSVAVYTPTLISFTLLIFPQILYGIPRTASATPNLQESGVAQAGDFSGVKGGQLVEDVEPEGPFVELGQRVLRVMEEQKPYLNPDFTLEDLARLMGVPKHHLYYCFQHILKTKFTRLRTEFRIEYAKKQLTEADLTQTTLNILGRESGFASTSAFYTTFKSEVGCSPGEFAARVNPTVTGGDTADNR